MRILVLTMDYAQFLEGLYSKNPGLENHPFSEQMEARFKTLFGVFDAYTHHLRLLGHEAIEVNANNRHAQFAWARENHVPIKLAWRLWPRPFHVFIPYSTATAPWFHDILAEQIRHYQPDVVLNIAMDGIATEFLCGLKPHIGLLCGQLAAPVPSGWNYQGYDLFVSSLPNMVEQFRARGIRSEYVPLAFDRRVLEQVPADLPKDIDVSFVGNLFGVHAKRIQWIEEVLRHVDVKIWGGALRDVSPQSPIRKMYQGEAWGVDMYRLLARSKVTLNCHIDIAGDYANNLRLYEATGVGSLLITDFKPNLGELFDTQTQVLAYRSAQECVELIRHALADSEAAARIAAAGQARTLRDHTYLARMKTLVDHFQSVGIRPRTQPEEARRLS